jgi:hypothetical protein
VGDFLAGQALSGIIPDSDGLKMTAPPALPRVEKK